MGFDAVVQEMSRPKTKAAGILLAADVSAKTLKEAGFEAAKHGVQVLQAEFTMDEAKDALGKRCGVFLITDAGLFGSVTKNIQSR